MKIDTGMIRSGWDGKKCLVHARFTATSDGKMVATAQHLDVSGNDLFDGIFSAVSYDCGRSFSEFAPEEGLAAVTDGAATLVGCDATPFYHKATGKILLVGHTVKYAKDGSQLAGGRSTFYSVLDRVGERFSRMALLQMPAGYENCGCGCGQIVELSDGELLIPVYYSPEGRAAVYHSTVLRCSFDGEALRVLEIGNSLTVPKGRGLYEPSLVCHKGKYYMTLRADDCAMVSESSDGLRYSEPTLWRWDDGEALDSYNTQQHWMRVGDELWLVYTRRGANNDHVFRHRAPLFAARVENMRLVRSEETVVVPERGARLGNFCATTLPDGRGAVMAAEWMQPAGCEKYGSDNAIFLTVIEK